MHGTLDDELLQLLSSKDEWTTEDLITLEETQGAVSRDNFALFRKFIRPKLLHAWWQQDVAMELSRFWDDYINHRKPAIVLQAPPQHGKTETITDFVAWAAGRDPESKTIFASYSEDLGIRVNLTLQRMMDAPRYKTAFANTRLNDANVVTQSGRWLRNSSILEYVGHEGSFRNTTVMGQINGQGLDLGVVDDPIKGRAEAQSKSVRDKTWSWFTDDFFGRFSEHAGFIMIMTRWHLDDPVGRWIEHFPKTRVLRYPAIAEEDEIHRRKGEALFPELKSLEFLDRRRQVLSQASWESIYQQRPIAAGGDMFPTELFGFTDQVARRDVKRSVRYIDKAGSEGHGAYTAMALVHEMIDGTYIVEDVRRGQWSALQRETYIEQTARMDAVICPRYEVYVEQEPGSGGKESAEATIRRLKGLKVFADRVTGSKEIRAEPYAAQVQAGNVTLCRGEWNRAFVDEHETFPAGKYKDQVDATSGAFTKLSMPRLSYDTTLAWIDGTPL